MQFVKYNEITAEKQMIRPKAIFPVLLREKMAFYAVKINPIVSEEAMNASRWLAAAAAGICIAGCGEEQPFDAVYTSRNQVRITYQNRQYILDRYGSPAQVPFRYRFEDDGDLDLTIDGRNYEVDSPYDIDWKKPKKKKSVNKAAARKKTDASRTKR